MDVQSIMSNSNILRPHLYWMGNRCFRVVGDCYVRAKPQMIETEESLDLYEEYDVGETEASSWNIEMLKEGSFEAKLPVPSVCYGFIIGTKNKGRNEIEKCTNTRINIPGHGRVGDIVVSGPTKIAVSRACDRIAWKVAEKRAKSRPTHFLCIPCNTPNILEKFGEFKKEVIELGGIDELLFQSPMKLHLTIAMLTLLDEKEVERASQLIQELMLNKIKPMTQESSVIVTLKGVEIMSDDSQNANVLYGCVEDSNAKKIIQNIGIECMIMLDKAGFGSKSNDKTAIKLHATLMNSKFKRLKLEAAQSNGNSMNHKRIDCSFNGVKILQTFKNFEFGSVSANSLRLAACGSKGSDGAHEVISEHSFVN